MEEQDEKQSFNYDLMLIVINIAKALKQVLNTVDMAELDNLEKCVLGAKINEMMAGEKNIDMITEENFSKNLT